MESQVENAILIAWNPHSDISLKQQAIEYVNQIREDTQSWTVCLPLATRRPPPAEIVQHTAIDVVDNAIQGDHVTQQDLLSIRENMVNYVQQAYGTRQEGQQDSINILNKFVEGFTYLFTKLYASDWPTFFDDLLALTVLNTSPTAEQDVLMGTKFYLKVVNSIHDEIADVLLAKSPEEAQRDTILKDLVRERDVQKITAAWHSIISKFDATDSTIIELCLSGIGRWASWIDLSLIVNDAFMSVLFAHVMNGLSGDSLDATRLRDAALGAYTEILSKKMKPIDKINLMEAIKVGELVSGLTASPLLNDKRFTSEYDSDFAEIVARLVNGTVMDIAIILRDASHDEAIRSRADQYLKTFMPYLLRFFSDEYDEVCSITIPSLTELLTFFRKQGKDNTMYKLMLPSILQAIMNKMKYDETSDWGQEDDQTDEAEFQELRMRLQNLQQAVSAIDEQLFIDTISKMVISCFESFRNNPGSVHWRDLDLALHQMFLFGQLAVRNGNIYSKTKPVSAAAEQLIAMIFKLIETDVASSSHPAIHLQFMEVCVRYSGFFEVNTQTIVPVLEKFVLFVHSSHPKVKQRSWYLLHRFVKQLGIYLGNIAQTVIQAVSDLLPIKAELSEDGADDDMSSEEIDQTADGKFASQLYLYEAVGNICSPPAVPLESKVLYIRSVMSPLFDDLQNHLLVARSGDARAILQVHHVIMALGTLAHGFSEWTPNNTNSPTAPVTEVADEFAKAVEAILVALESLNSSLEIRTAARSSFSRLVGVLGNRILSQLPRWIQGLLSQASGKDEIAMFLRLLDQVVFGFKTEIFDILNGLLSPFLQRVFEGMREPVNGTDDQIQLTELKGEYMGFILAVLSNGQGGVFISNENQPLFETVISTLEHFTKDPLDFSSAKLAFTTIVTMVSTWGGPDVVKSDGTATRTSAQPVIPGFDRFAIERFSPLVWALPGNSSFNPRDAQARHVLSEAAGLQMTVYMKIGPEYLSYLEQTELKNLGLDESGIKEYIQTLATADIKKFRRYFATLIQKLR